MTDIINLIDRAAAGGWALLLPLGVAAVLAVATAAWLIGRIVRIARSDRPDEPLSNLGMLTGLGWSSEAVWVLTGPGGADLPNPVRAALFLILETILVVFMIRAKRNVREIGYPGVAGRFAWCVAAGMSLVAVTTAHNLGEAFLRLLVPLLLTAMWWNGLVGEKKREPNAEESRLAWTPRNFLIWIGAITPGKGDVKTVHRERLTQRMTNLYYDSLYGPEDKREKLRTRLARLTLDADDEIVQDVMRRVRRTQWTTAKPMPYEPTQAGDAPVTQGLTQADAPGDAAGDAHVAVPPARRSKSVTQPVTSGDAGDADPAMQAAHLVLTQGLSTRKAADAVGKTSPATVGRRVKELRLTQPDAAGDAPVTHSPINGHPALAESAN